MPSESRVSSRIERPAGAAREDRHPPEDTRPSLDSAVKPVDGFFTTFFVTPYSKHLARWAAGRGRTPNEVTVVSALVGFAAAAAFATGQRAGLIAGAVLLQVAFTADCVDGQLARYTGSFTSFGAWLDSTFDRVKEYAVFAGLAIGASAAGDPVWVLAGAALALQTARHVELFSFAVARPRARVEAPGRPLGVWGRLDAVPAALWVKRIVAFPIGERFAAISLTAALFTPRTTFAVLLAWGGFAAVYTTAGLVLRSLR